MDAKLEAALLKVPFYTLGQVDTEVDAVLTRLGLERELHAECIDLIVQRGEKAKAKAKATVERKRKEREAQGESDGEDG